jgi:maltose alpha-D-glucosyltransferase/alpha-amylase
VRLEPLAYLDGAGRYALAAMQVRLPSGTQRYLAPLSIRWGEEHIRTGAPKLSYTLAKVRAGARVGALVDGTYDEALAAELVALMRAGESRALGEHRVAFHGSRALSEIDALAEPRPLGVEQSNVSIVFGDQIILKIYRRMREGEQPDVEVARHLTDVARYPHTPALVGTIELEGEGDAPAVLAAAFDFVPNQGDAWSAVLDGLSRHLEGVDLIESDTAVENEPLALHFPLDIGPLAGQRTAEMHLALAAAGGSPAFRPEPVTAADLAAWADQATREADALLTRLEAALSALPEDVAVDARALIARRDDIAARLDAVRAAEPSGDKTRIHGDYHLGQVLVAQDDLVVIDFEGEPTRPLEERRARTSPLKDVAGMLRSFDYAAAVAWSRWREAHEGEGEAARAKALAWRDATRGAFLKAYFDTLWGAAPAPGLTAALLDLFTLQKAIYEIGYELSNRPGWVRIPLAGVLDVLADPRGVSAWAALGGAGQTGDDGNDAETGDIR